MSQEESYYFSMLDRDCRMVHRGELNYFPAAFFHSSSYYTLLKKLKLLFLYIRMKLFGSKYIFCHCWNSLYLPGMVIPSIIYHSLQAIPCAIPTACLVYYLLNINSTKQGICSVELMYFMCFSGQHEVCRYSVSLSLALFFESGERWVGVSEAGTTYLKH